MTASTFRPLWRGIVVTHGPGTIPSPWRIIALALILSLIRKVPESERGVRAGQWHEARHSTHENGRPHPRHHRARRHRAGGGQKMRGRFDMESAITAATAWRTCPMPITTTWRAARASDILRWPHRAEPRPGTWSMPTSSPHLPKGLCGEYRARLAGGHAGPHAALATAPSPAPRWMWWMGSPLSRRPAGCTELVITPAQRRPLAQCGRADDAAFPEESGGLPGREHRL